MANNVTINITNNCGCCGSGGSGGSGSGPENILDGVMEGEILDPEIEGPPKGYIGPGTSITDRQCKMAVWLYTWVEGIFDTFANSNTGDVLLTVIATMPASLMVSVMLRFVTPVIIGAVTFVIAALGTPGVPDEYPLTVLSTIVSYGIASIITNQTVVKNFTKPTAAKILEQLKLGKDDLICALAKAANPYEAKAEYEKVLATLDLSITQRAIAIVFLNNQFLYMLFYTAEWWPSFDENILANVSATCCGDIRDGDPIEPGSTQACQAASYIIDKLIETFNITNDYVEWFFYFNANPFDNDTAYIRTQVEEGLEIPAKIKEKAASYSYYVSMVASYINGTTITGGLIDHFFGTHFGDLATELQTNRATIHAALMAAADEAAVYSAIYDPLDAYIQTNVESSNPDLADYLRGAISALLAPTQSKIPEMMFVQDGATAFYAIDECLQCTARTFDTFTAADSTRLKDHNPDEDGAGAGGWSEDVGTWSIETGQAKSSGAVASRATIQTCLADCTLTCDVTVEDTGSNASAYQGLIFRYKDGQNHFLFTWKGGGDPKLQLRQQETGSGNMLLQEESLILSGSHEFKVVLNGSQVDCYIDDVLKFSHTSTFNVTRTRHGMRSGEASLTRFDNFKVESLV